MRLSCFIASPLVFSSVSSGGLFSKPNHAFLGKKAPIHSLFHQKLNDPSMKIPAHTSCLTGLNSLADDHWSELGKIREIRHMGEESYAEITAKIDQKFWPVFERAGVTRQAWVKGLQLWSGEGRFYHSPTHLQSLLNDIEAINDPSLSQADYERLIVIAFFHDVIYQPNKPKDDPKTNEQKSVEYYQNALGASHSPDPEVVRTILATEGAFAPEPTPENALARRFWLLDYGIVKKDFPTLLIWERDIFKEFSPFCSLDFYKEKRAEFLQSCFSHPDLQLDAEQKENLNRLIEQVKNIQPNT
jgi:predicted metal-dependent HD superfamily phosphohydrolase